jgi:5'-methylthioadenosine nucleosidase
LKSISRINNEIIALNRYSFTFTIRFRFIINNFIGKNDYQTVREKKNRLVFKKKSCEEKAREETTVSMTMTMTTIMRLALTSAANKIITRRSNFFSRLPSPQSFFHYSYFYKNYYSVLVPIVMEAEATPFVEHLELKPVEDFFPSNTPFLAFSGAHGKTKVTVITMGKDTVYETGVDNVGTVPASLATYLAVEKIKTMNDGNDLVDLILNAGTCGGFNRMGGAIGDVYLTSGVANHDRRIAIPGFTEYGHGKIASDIDPTNMAKELGFKTGIASTSNSLDKTDTCDEIMKDHNASVKDMEAAAIAYIAKMQNLPYMGVKVITDIVDGGRPSQDEFFENLASAAKSLQSALPKVMDYLCDEKRVNGEL